MNQQPGDDNQTFLGMPMQIVPAGTLFGPHRRCGNCQHWSAAVNDREFGQCLRVLHQDGDPPEKGWGDSESIHDEPAVVVDGSGYYAALRTKPTFCCSLWEEKKDEPAT